MNRNDALKALESAGHWDCYGRVDLIHITYNINVKELTATSIIDREAHLRAAGAALPTAFQLEVARYSVNENGTLGEGTAKVMNIEASFHAHLTSVVEDTQFVITND